MGHMLGLATKQTLGRTAPGRARHGRQRRRRRATGRHGEGATLGIELRTSGGIAEVIIDFPPVNALPVQGWFDLANAVTATGADAAVRAVVIAAEGRGFCAGVDIKQMQQAPGHEALLGASRGCFAAFAAVYDCPVPVIAAVQGFCLGGGVGLAGNADIVIAADDATSGLRAAARAVAGEIAAKDPTTIRLAKQSLNGIDPVDVKRSYRYEQGFTFELNLTGVPDAARQAFTDRQR